MEKTKILLTRLLVIPLCLVLFIHCGGDQKMERIIAQYTIKPINKFMLYGVDINKIIDKPFSEIEKKLNSKTRIDREVSVAFIRIEKDFVPKTTRTEYKDSIDIVYGPIEDTNIYEKYEGVVPNSIRFYGELNVNEKPDTKNAVLEELKRNLPDSDTTKRALNDIQNAFLKGNYRGNSVIKIDFEMTKFPLAEFSIRYVDKNKILYEYTFSRKKEVYP